jgi:2-polyprenyl-3-methyl-5-hydroxy-6-metoxy-1,4-benzoquinol methylase
MLTLQQKIGYLIDSTVRYNTSLSCPYCQSSSAKLIDRKYFVTRLFKCNQCQLQFRHPLESIESNKNFYQLEYFEEDGITTDLPSVEELSNLKKTGFKAYPDRDAQRIIDILAGLFPVLDNIKMIDYGTSWGYFSYQFKQKNIDIESYEISVPRANFGNKYLELNIKTQTDELRKDNDIFFSSHVIEHLPKIQDMVNLSKSLLRQEGYFVALCPNGSRAYREKNPLGFHKTWGKVHPNLLSADFYQYVFKDNPYLIASSPYDLNAISQWDKKTQTVLPLEGEELLIIAKINQNLSS